MIFIDGVPNYDACCSSNIFKNIETIPTTIFCASLSRRFGFIFSLRYFRQEPIELVT